MSGRGFNGFNGLSLNVSIVRQDPQPTVYRDILSSELRIQHLQMHICKTRFTKNIPQKSQCPVFVSTTITGFSLKLTRASLPFTSPFIRLHRSATAARLSFQTWPYPQCGGKVLQRIFFSLPGSFLSHPILAGPSSSRVRPACQKPITYSIRISILLPRRRFRAVTKWVAR